MEVGNSSLASDQYPPSSPTMSTSTVLGMPGQLNLDTVSASADTEEGEFDRRCELLINGVLGGNDRTAADVLTALMAFADLSPGAAPLDVSGKVKVLQYLQGTVQGAVGGDVDGVMHEASNLVLMATQRSEKSSSEQGEGTIRRGGGGKEEAAIDAAVEASREENPQLLADMEDRVVQAAAPVVAASESAAGFAPDQAVSSAEVNAAADANPGVRLAVARVEGMVQGIAIRTALQAVGQGLYCGLQAGGGGGGAWIIQAIRAAGGATVYQVRQRIASFTAGVVALGTWAAGYWAPGSVAKMTCMTVLTPFMTRNGAGPWCGVQVETSGMFRTAQQFAVNFLPGGAFWETLGIFGTATTERYDIAARAVFATVTALVIIGFGSWTGLFAAAGGSLRSAARNALSIVKQYFTGAISDEVALKQLLLTTYQQLENTWEQQGGNEEDSFQACLALAVALRATPDNLMAGGSAFGSLAEHASIVVDGVSPVEVLAMKTAASDVLGFSLSVGGADVPGHSPSSLPKQLKRKPNLINVVKVFLTNDNVAQAISNLPAPAADLADGARAKYMQLRSLLQLAAVTAGALVRAQESVPGMNDATQQELQAQFQRTMQTYRDMQINSLLAAEDLALAFAANVGHAIMPAPGGAPGQGGGRRRRRTRRSKPRSRARRKGNKKKTRVGKRRRTRRH